MLSLPAYSVPRGRHPREGTLGTEAPKPTALLLPWEQTLLWDLFGLLLHWVERGNPEIVLPLGNLSRWHIPGRTRHQVHLTLVTWHLGSFLFICREPSKSCRWGCEQAAKGRQGAPPVTRRAQEQNQAPQTRSQPPSAGLCSAWRAAHGRAADTSRLGARNWQLHLNTSQKFFLAKSLLLFKHFPLSAQSKKQKTFLRQEGQEVFRNKARNSPPAFKHYLVLTSLLSQQLKE